MRTTKLIAVLIALLASAVVQAAQIKIATIAPENSQWMTEMRAAAKQIKERTEGRVVVKFYGGGVMGNDRKVLRKIRNGQLQGGAFAASGLLEKFPDLGVYGMPLLFRTQAEVDYVQSQIDAELQAGLEKAGFVSFGFAGGGFAYLMGSNPAATIEDLRGKKMWVPEGDQITYESMEAMNLSPVVLPISDVLTGLQTGLVEYIATPSSAALLLQWYTKVKYITDLPIAYTMGVMAVDKKAFSKLSAEDQAVFREVMEGIYKKFDQINRADNESADKALAANGLEIVKADPAAIPVWREQVSASNRKIWAEGNYTPDLLSRVEAMLEEFRANNPAE